MLSISNNQIQHSNYALLFIIRACSLQWDPFSLQRVLSTSKVHKVELTYCSKPQPRRSEFHQLSRNPRLPSIQTTYYKFHFAVDVKLHLPRFQKSHSFACEMLHAFGTIDSFSTIFYNKVHFINIHTNIILKLLNIIQHSYHLRLAKLHPFILFTFLKFPFYDLFNKTWFSFSYWTTPIEISKWSLGSKTTYEFNNSISYLSKTP